VKWIEKRVEFKVIETGSLNLLYGSLEECILGHSKCPVLLAMIEAVVLKLIPDVPNGRDEGI
jgi:hypothetical protein